MTVRLEAHQCRLVSLFEFGQEDVAISQRRLRILRSLHPGPAEAGEFQRMPGRSKLRVIRAERDGHVLLDLGSHLAGRADHGNRLWLLLNAEIWHRAHVEGVGVAELGARTIGRPLATAT